MVRSPHPTRPTPRARASPHGGAGEDAADGPSDASAPRSARVGPRANALRDAEYRAMLAALKAAREAAGFTLEEVAARLGRPMTYVWKSENGERRLDAIELWRFAGLYGRPVADFLPRRPYTPDADPPSER